MMGAPACCVGQTGAGAQNTVCSAAVLSSAGTGQQGWLAVAAVGHRRPPLHPTECCLTAAPPLSHFGHTPCACRRPGRLQVPPRQPRVLCAGPRVPGGLWRAHHSRDRQPRVRSFFVSFGLLCAGCGHPAVCPGHQLRAGRLLGALCPGCARCAAAPRRAGLWPRLNLLLVNLPCPTAQLCPTALSLVPTALSCAPTALSLPPAAWRATSLRQTRRTWLPGRSCSGRGTTGRRRWGPQPSSASLPCASAGVCVCGRLVLHQVLV